MKGVRKDVRDNFSDVVDRVASRGAKRGRILPEYAENPIQSAREMEPCPFTAYSIPMPIITRQTQPQPLELNVAEPVEEEATTPIPIGFSTLVDDQNEPPKNRVVFRKPNISGVVE